MTAFRGKACFPCPWGHIKLILRADRETKKAGFLLIVHSFQGPLRLTRVLRTVDLSPVFPGDKASHNVHVFKKNLNPALIPVLGGQDW